MRKIDIKKGDLVEFTDKYYQHYPPEDKSVIKYGVCTQDYTTEPITVETVNGIEVPRYIWSYSWSGWFPEELEPIYLKYCPPEDYDYEGLE